MKHQIEKTNDKEEMLQLKTTENKMKTSNTPYFESFSDAYQECATNGIPNNQLLICKVGHENFALAIHTSLDIHVNTSRIKPINYHSKISDAETQIKTLKAFKNGLSNQQREPLELSIRNLWALRSEGSQSSMNCLFSIFLNATRPEKITEVSKVLADYIVNFPENHKNVKQLCCKIRQIAYHPTSEISLPKLNLLVSLVLDAKEKSKNSYYHEPSKVKSQFGSYPLGNNRLLNLLESELNTFYDLEEAIMFLKNKKLMVYS